MADWKRTRQLLSGDEAFQRERAFSVKGLEHCMFAPDHPGPTRHLYDCAFNHYQVQQNLYACFLRRKYNISLSRLLLVQCHPDIGATDADFHEAEVPQDADVSYQILVAFKAGWHKLFDT